MKRRKPTGGEGGRGRFGKHGPERRHPLPSHPDPAPRQGERRLQPSGGRYWLYGLHAAAAALANPRRRLVRGLATTEAQMVLADPLETARTRLGNRFSLEGADTKALAARLGPEAVHQGVALEVEPLAQPVLADLLATCAGEASLVLLDQVTDPHNVGAILRSAAAFGAAAVIVTEHHSPAESGSLAKAASGGLEQVPMIRAPNLSQAMELLKREGFWCFGLAAEAAQSIAEADLRGRVAFVLGAEGTGLRRLTRERCDLLLRLPTIDSLIQLNVSNAAAIALYERARQPSSGTRCEPEPG